MESLNIVCYPSETLRRVCQDVTVFDEQLESLVHNMTETMDCSRGVGLAAPQVGILKNIIVFKMMEGDEEFNSYLINPRILEHYGSFESEEGCLSLPGLVATVTRAERIVVAGQDVAGQSVEYDIDSFTSIIIQHETDHLFGRLFIDRLSPAKKERVLRKYHKRLDEDVSRDEVLDRYRDQARRMDL